MTFRYRSRAFAGAAVLATLLAATAGAPVFATGSPGDTEPLGDTAAQAADDQARQLQDSTFLVTGSADAGTPDAQTPAWRADDTPLSEAITFTAPAGAGIPVTLGSEAFELPEGTEPTGHVTISIEQLTAPDGSATWLVDPASNQLLLASWSGGPQELQVPVGQTLAVTWWFSPPGEYRLQLQAELPVTDAGGPRTLTATPAVLLVDVDEGPAPEPTEPAPTPPGPSQPAPSEPAPTRPAPTTGQTNGPTTAPTTAPTASAPSAPGTSATPSASPSAPIGTPDPSASASPPATPSASATAAPGATEPAPSQDAVWDVPNGYVNAAGATVLNEGHIDIASLVEGERLVTTVKDTTRSSDPTWRSLDTTVLQLLPTSQTTVPDAAAYGFLGEAGSTIWQVSHTQQPGLLWPGWSTEHIPTDATEGGVTWALTGITGPGDFIIYHPSSTSLGGVDVRFNTRDGITEADQFVIPKNTHAHGSWAFTAEGDYCLSMERVTRLASGAVASDRFHIAVAVGTADVSRLDPAACGTEQTSDAPASASVAPPAATGQNPAADDVPAAQQVSGEQCEASAIVLSSGHIDYASRIVNGKLETYVGDDTSGSGKIYREPSSTVLWLRPQSQVTLPGGYEQVAPGGTTVWQVPQSQNAELIWLGWSTELLNSGNTQSQVGWRLDSIDGPGTVTVYLTGAFGGVQELVLNGAGSQYTIALGVHAHGNWAFSQQGIYRLRFTQSVVLPDGQTSSDTETLTIAVGDVDPASAIDCQNVTGGDGAVPLTEQEQPAVAAEQAAAPPVAQAVQGLQPDSQGEDDLAAAQGPDASGEQRNSRVPLLLGTLGGVLVLGGAGTGALWWWRRGAAGPLT